MNLHCLLNRSRLGETKIMAFSPITSQQIDGETIETLRNFIFLSSRITSDDDCSHEIKRRLLLGRKVMTDLDSILKSRGITLPTKVCLVKIMVFAMVMYGCEWKVKSLSHVQLFATPWTVAYQASPSMGFSRQEYWSGLPFPSPEDLPHSGIKPRSPIFQAHVFTLWATREADGIESWTIKKAQHQRTDAFELCCWRRLLRVPWTGRRSN